jgi:hypothetical protein
MVKRSWASHAAGKLLATSVALRRSGVNKESLIEMNDCGRTFKQIADYLDLELINLA